MSTLTTRDTVVQPVNPGADGTQPGAVEATGGRSVMSRLLNWYRNAVLSPATETEKEEWQQDSF